MTPEDIEAEYWAHHYAERARAGEKEVEDDDFDAAEILGRLDAGDDWDTVING